MPSVPSHVARLLGAAGLVGVLFLSSCGSSSNEKGKDASAASSTTTDHSVVDRIVADVSPDGLREEGRKRVDTSGDKAEIPPNWPADLTMPDGFVLQSSFWDKVPTDGVRQQRVVGTIPGTNWEDVYGELETIVTEAGYGDPTEDRVTDAPESITLHAGRGDQRIVLKVGAAKSDSDDNLIEFTHYTDA